MAYEGLKQAFASFVGMVQENYANISDSVKESLAEAISLITEKVRGLKDRPLSSPIPDTARLLWELSGRNPEPFAQYIQQFPAPELQQLAQSPNRILETVERLQREMPPEKLGEMDGIPEAWLQSSNVYGYQYDPSSRKLRVRFNNGGVYEYMGVPKEIYDLFNDGAIPARTEGENEWGAWWPGKKPSLGASLHWLIKQGGFPYVKLA